MGTCKVRFTGNNQYSDLSLEDRFWEKVDKKSDDECWEWLGSVCSGGYGSININGKATAAHRISWILKYGFIENLKGTDFRGTCVLHRCDNRLCVNPNHLFLGSADDNMKDMARKGRGRTKEQRGECNPRSKLTNKDIINIREMYTTEKYLQREIAEIYRITFQTVSDIVNRKSWRHL